MFKESRVVMLPTEKANVIKGCIMKSDTDERLSINNQGWMSTFTGYTPQFIYIYQTKALPKIGDWVYSVDRGVFKLGRTPQLSDYKIIASDDPELNLPKPSDKFKKKFVECNGEGMSVIDVEYHEQTYEAPNGDNYTMDACIKTDAYNTITIRKHTNKTFNVNEIPIEAILNLVGLMDTPVGRRLYSKDVIDQVQTLREFANTHNLGKYVNNEYNDENFI